MQEWEVRAAVWRGSEEQQRQWKRCTEASRSPANVVVVVQAVNALFDGGSETGYNV